ncbi:MAG: ABC transporter permease [Chloroflexi bacterium]|nr:ABC transporter permease [Chloroflexota bacterium]
MRLVDLLRTAISNSLRSKLRTSLTVIAIFVGAFTLTMTSAIGTGITSYIGNQVASFGASDVLTVTRTADDQLASRDGPAPYDPDAPTLGGGGFGGGGGGGFAPTPLSDADLGTIAATPGILTVDPIVPIMPSYIQHAGGERFELSVNATAALGRVDLAAGSQLSTDGTRNEIVLPTSYLDALGFENAEAAVGQGVIIGITDYLGVMHEVEAVIVGVQNESLFGSTAALGRQLTDELVAIADTGRPESLRQGYFAATATFDPDAGAEEVTAIKAHLADQGFTAQTVADQIGILQTVIDGVILIFNGFAVIALLAASFGIVNTLLMSVQERTREIGLMKAMGMSGRTVFALFSVEAAFIGFLGSAIGALVAIMIGTLISGILADTVLSGLEGLQVMQFAPASVATIILIVMAIAFFAGTLPARRASRQDPIDALRYE